MKSNRYFSKNAIDHRGNEYPSFTAMCRAYGINQRTVKTRLDNGMSLKDALTKSPGSFGTCHGCRHKDHLGNEYQSFREMCSTYGLSDSTVYNRLKRGCSLKEALTTSIIPTTRYESVDHLGNRYQSFKDMCMTYGLDSHSVKARLDKGYSLEVALTAPRGSLVSKRSDIKDHLGNTYSSFKAMCKVYGHNSDTVKKRLKKGYSLEKALTLDVDFSSSDVNKRRCTPCNDHLGNTYPSEAERAKAYGLKPHIIRRRLSRGWSLEDALTRKPSAITCAKSLTDHCGNHFDSVEAAAKHWNIRTQTLRDRLERGWPIEDALTKPSGYRLKPYGVTHSETALPTNKTVWIKDHLGQEFASKKEMAEYYGIDPSTLRRRLNSGMTLEEALTAVTPSKSDTAMITTDHHGNKYSSFTKMCNTYGKSRHTVKRRLDKGATLEDALTFEGIYPYSRKQPGLTKYYDHKGTSYNSLKDMCLAYNISTRTYMQRIRFGWSKKDALCGKRKDSDKEKFLLYDHMGNSYNSYNELGEKYGINPKTIKQRLYAGKSMEEALTTPVSNTGRMPKEYIVEGKLYHSLSEVAREYNIPRNTLEKKVKKYGNIEDALKSGVQYHKPRNSEVADNRGHTFKNLKEACEYYNKNQDTVFARLKNGWNIDEALIIPAQYRRILAMPNKPLFTLDGVDYHEFKCPVCNVDFVFNRSEARKHILSHVERSCDEYTS